MLESNGHPLVGLGKAHSIKIFYTIVFCLSVKRKELSAMIKISASGLPAFALKEKGGL
ncbi:hypothetical protein [Bacillus subtilis]|uniref:hypothetical protein n=1 Tax=Bacillus subtilis TaxID=1423 RepID=UPI000A771AE2|nr:hypothetical protein [Bacillus subtilis]MBO3767546.1 hypothetical protein [Bacillus subtilis]